MRGSEAPLKGAPFKTGGIYKDGDFTCCQSIQEGMKNCSNKGLKKSANNQQLTHPTDPSVSAVGVVEAGSRSSPLRSLS